jgi:hypothetical protein
MDERRTITDVMRGRIKRRGRALELFPFVNHKKVTVVRLVASAAKIRDMLAHQYGHRRAGILDRAVDIAGTNVSWHGEHPADTRKKVLNHFDRKGGRT